MLTDGCRFVNVVLAFAGAATGGFINNYAQGTSSSAYGGAISNSSNSTIGNITGDFINNYAQGTYAYGGAIYNSSNSTIGFRLCIMDILHQSRPTSSANRTTCLHLPAHADILTDIPR